MKIAEPKNHKFDIGLQDQGQCRTVLLTLTAIQTVRSYNSALEKAFKLKLFVHLAKLLQISCLSNFGK